MFKDLSETVVLIAVSVAIIAITYSTYSNVLTGFIERAFALVAAN